MTIVLRCEGDERSGAGHVARCLPIGHAFRRAGHDVAFVGTYSGVSERLLDAAGFERSAPTAKPAGLPADARAAVVDVYTTTDAELAEAARERPVAAFRDVRQGAAAMAPAIAVDYHLDAGVSGPCALRGPDFAPLDPALTAARCDRRSGSVLVALGGSTAGERALPALVDALLAGAGADVEVAGALAPAADPRVRYAGRLAGLTGALRRAGAVICGAGVTAYEAACAGVPALLVVLAANQERVAGAFADLAPVLDGREPIDPAQARSAIAALPDARIGREGPALVDGLGALRVRNALLAALAGTPAPPVQRYRPVIAADAALLRDWRNEPAVRAVSGSTEPISAAEHEEWLARGLSDPDRTLLVAERDREPVGSVRFHRRDGEAEISVAVAPARRTQGAGAQAIRETTEHELAARPELRRIVARVGAANAPSRRAFERAGYQLAATEGAWLVLEGLR